MITIILTQKEYTKNPNTKTTYLFNENHERNATIHNFEEKIEVLNVMNKNGINVFTDAYKCGNVSKAFYQWNLTKYEDYQ